MNPRRLGFQIRPMQSALRGCLLAAVIFGSPALAQEAAQNAAPEAAPPVEMKSPRLVSANVDWDAARAALAAFDQTAPNDETPSASAPDVLALLNDATAKALANIAASPIPVLLPFDTAALLRDQAQGPLGDIGRYFVGFAPTFFFAGPSGYDAVLRQRPQDRSGLDLTYAKPVNVQISGSTLLYDLDGPAVSDGSPVPELEDTLPGIRRVLLESHLRYNFVRFGVPYSVSILCSDGPSRGRRLSCREADKVAVRLLNALAIAGGSPQAVQPNAVAQTVERPAQTSSDFTYYAPGDLIPGSGMKGQDGRADTTVYSRMRFPTAQAPDYVNSQSYMNWGDCNFTGRVGLGERGKYPAYRCKVNDKPLVQDESQNYAYPWRDNFCEHRDYYVGQCPAGLGHQGEDIRPGTCMFRTDGTGRCAPLQNDVVAVRDGVLMRDPRDEALYLVVDKPGEHIRFRYLHMNPQMLDAAGMISGRAVTEGEVLGAVDNYGRSEGGTTYHLHFDVQVLTRDGWVFVNPYLTLVTAYERLIGGRGQVVRDAEFATASLGGAPATDGQNVSNSAAIAPPQPAATAKPATDAIIGSAVRAESAGGNTPKIERDPASERNINAAEYCQTRFVKGHRRRLCGVDIARARPREKLTVRPVDRGVSQQGRVAWHHRGDIHARHARNTSRHNGA
jgi:hypothetical protein